MKPTSIKFKPIIILLLLVIFGFRENKNQIKIRNIITEKDFNNCFPFHNKFYSYVAFKEAVREMDNIVVKIEKRGDWIYKITRTDKRINKSVIVRQDKDWEENWAKEKPYKIIVIDYRNFCGDKNPIVNKKELAALFAHVAHETRNGFNNQFNDGLMLITELNTKLEYINTNLIYPAVNGKKYYGRGPLQLSYNGNYGFASDCIFGDKNILLNNPDLLSSNAIVAFETAIYFWMTPQASKPSAHDVMVGQWKPTEDEIKNGYKPGFGMTINIINGNLECNKGENQISMKDRIGFYQNFLKKFKVSDENCNCSCGQMQPYIW